MRVLATLCLLLPAALALRLPTLLPSRRAVASPLRFAHDGAPVATGSVYKDNMQRLLAAAALCSASALLRPRPSNAAVEEDCSDSLTIMQDPESKRKVILFGTAHISQRSADLVRDIISKNRPQVVLVELDAKRIAGDRFSDERGAGTVEMLESRGFILPSKSKELLATAAAARRNTGFFSGAFKGLVAGFGGAVLGRIIGQFYKSIESLGVVAGGEFKAAIEEAAKLGNCRVLLGDRDIDATLSRLAQALSQTDEQQFNALQGRIEAIERESGMVPASESVFGDKAALTTFVEQVRTSKKNHRNTRTTNDISFCR